MKVKKIKQTLDTAHARGKDFEDQTKDWIREHFSQDIESIECQYKLNIRSEDIVKTFIKNHRKVLKKFKNFNSLYIFDFRVVLKNGQEIYIESKSRDSKANGKKDSKQGLNKDVAADGVVIKGQLLQIYAHIEGIKNYKYVVVSNAFPKITNNNYLKLFLACYIQKVIDEVVILDKPEQEKCTVESLFN